MAERTKRKLVARKKWEKVAMESAVYQFPPVHTFGFSGIRWRLSQIASLNSETVVFAIGCGLYKYRDFCSVPLLPAQASTEKISCMTVSESGRLMVVCEKLKGEPSSVTLFKMAKNPIVVTRYFINEHEEIGNVGLSKDEKQIVALCSPASDAKLYCWNLDLPMPRFVMHYPHNVTRISVSVGSADVFAVTGTIQLPKDCPTNYHPSLRADDPILRVMISCYAGPGAIKIWSIDENLIETYDDIAGLEEPGTGVKCILTDHVWLIDDSIAISTENKVIFIVKGGEVKYKFLDTGHVLCMAVTPTGFYAGRKDGIIMQVGGWDVVKSEYSLRSTRPYGKGITMSSVSREDLPITTLVVAPNDPTVLYVVEAEKVGRLQLNPQFEEGTLNQTSNYTEEGLLSPVFDVVDYPMPVFTISPVTDMDICRSRMNIATSHQDQVVRIWSYARLVCDTTYPCDEEIQAVSINNYHLLVALGRVIKIFFLMSDNIVPIEDVRLKNVRVMRWSPSCAIVAVAAGKDIVLPSSTNWNTMATLKGHIGTVTSVAWSHDSIYLATAATDGAVLGWFMDGFWKYSECVTIGSLYSSIVYDRSRRFVYACGLNISLRALDTDKKIAIEQTLPEEINSDDEIPPVTDEEDENLSGSCWEHHIFRAQTSYEAEPKGITKIVGLFQNVKLCGSGLLCGTNDSGELVLYAAPLSKGCSPTWVEPINAGKTTSLAVDENHDLIVITSSQGSIHLLTVQKLPWSKDLPDPPEPRGFLPVDENSWVDILAVYKDDLEERKQNVQDFAKRAKKERDEMLYRDHMLEQEHIKTMREKDELSAKKESEYDFRLRLLEKRILMAESEKESHIQGLLESQEVTLKNMNEDCERRIIKEAEKANVLRSKVQKELHRLKDIMNGRQRACDAKLQDMKHELEGAQLAADKRVEEVVAKCDAEIQKCKLALDMELMFNDEEIEQALKKYATDLEDQRKRVEDVFGKLSYEKNIILQSQAIINQATAAEAEHDDKLHEVLMRDDWQENWRLKKLVLAIDKDRACSRSWLLETDERNENVLASLREQESHHIIYDYKIDKLTREKKPVAEEIRHLRSYLGNLKSEQADHLLDLKDVRTVEKDLKAKLSVNAVNLKKMLDKALTVEIYVNNFTAKLTQIIEENEQGKWPDLTKELYDTYVNDTHRQMNPDCLSEKTEMKHQRGVLQKFVKILQTAILRIDKEHAFAANRLVQKNIALLNGFSEANRNAQRLSSILKDLQGEEAYYRAVAAKHRYVTVAALTQMSQKRKSKIRKASKFSRSASKAKASATPATQFPARRSTSSSFCSRSSTALGTTALPHPTTIEPPQTTMQKKLERQRAKSSIAMYGSIRHPDNALALLATESELTKKDQDIKQLQKTLHRLSIEVGKSVAASPN
ncbi:uncharacterized protein [Physcomitrium patens]|uniref:uncharacterized protein isoform X3 n=1 Tax=Physcomitrium patens TaxID=3218 RepID=UPI003CCDE19A